MKQILILSCSALALSIAAAHAGDSNNVYLQQSSSGSVYGNSAVITQSGDNNIAGSQWSAPDFNAVLEQNGTKNRIVIDQNGSDMVKRVRQNGNFSSLKVEQKGPGGAGVTNPYPDQRVWNVIQTTEPGIAQTGNHKANRTKITQRGGERNVVGTVHQHNNLAGPIDSGDRNLAVIDQKGNRNGANINGVPPRVADPIPVGALATPYIVPSQHGGQLIQIGSGNTTRVTQHGNDNNFRASSIGKDNKVLIEQKSDASYARVELDGDANQAEVEQRGMSQWADIRFDTGDGNRFRTYQKGFGNFIDLTGSGHDSLFEFKQDTSTNIISANLSGDNNLMRIHQKGGDNNVVDMSGATNTGSNNRLYYLQDGDNNMLVSLLTGDDNRQKVHQKGGSNMTQIVVNGDGNKLHATQKGNMNNIDVAQTGNGNSSVISQGGDLALPSFGDSLF